MFKAIRTIKKIKQFQKEMYAWFLKRFSQNNVSQEIQDIETTNTKLKRAGYPEKELTKSEICAVLGVDAVISSDYVMTKPMPQGVAVAASVLLDYEGTTNEITANMNIYDKKTDKIFASDQKNIYIFAVHNNKI